MSGTYFSGGLPFSSSGDNFKIQYSYFEFKNKPHLMNLVMLPSSGQLSVHLKWFWIDQSNTNRPIGQTLPPNHRSTSSASTVGSHWLLSSTANIFCHESFCLANVNPLIKSKSKCVVQNVCSVSLYIGITTIGNQWSHSQSHHPLYR